MQFSLWVGREGNPGIKRARSQGEPNVAGTGRNRNKFATLFRNRKTTKRRKPIRKGWEPEVKGQQQQQQQQQQQ